VGDGPSYLLKNVGAGHAWVSIQPRGRTSNTTGIGAKISVSAKIAGQAFTQLREITQQTNWGGHGPLLAHVGLGDARVIDEVRIDWPSGNVDVERHVRRNTHYVAVEGRGLITLQEVLIERLIERVAELAAAGTIRRGQHLMLRATLLGALEIAGKHDKASEQLMNIFVKQVNALLRDEVLSELEASWLLDPSATARSLFAQAGR
jgi:ASPIC and UnbV